MNELVIESETDGRKWLFECNRPFELNNNRKYLELWLNSIELQPKDSNRINQKNYYKNDNKQLEYYDKNKYFDDYYDKFDKNSLRGNVNPDFNQNFLIKFLFS